MSRPIAMKKEGIQTRKRKSKGANPAGKTIKTGNSKNDSLLTNSAKHHKSKKKKIIAS